MASAISPRLRRKTSRAVPVTDSKPCIKVTENWKPRSACAPGSTRRISASTWSSLVSGSGDAELGGVIAIPANLPPCGRGDPVEPPIRTPYQRSIASIVATPPTKQPSQSPATAAAATVTSSPRLTAKGIRAAEREREATLPTSSVPLRRAARQR